ncbi:tyrosine-type recombinase/integrase [Sphingobium sp.]|uniref:tyrosine-type recombinase/integrase n=1 Tax=Sphingobium sp. TaxID=1912891 RepID=UPI003919DF70
MSEPEWLLHCQRILALPDKRYVKRSVTFLDGSEIAALLAAPDQSTWTDRRDHILLLVALQTGLRVSELTGLRCRDVVLGTGAHIRCLGKGRKERCTPLRSDTAKALQIWLKERRGEDALPLFPSIRGDPLSRDALEHLVRKHCFTAARSCPSLAAKRVYIRLEDLSGPCADGEPSCPIVEMSVTHATGTAGREAALVMIERTRKPGRRVTLAGDRLFDSASFVTALREREITPHIAINGTVSKLGKVRKTLIDRRTTRLAMSPACASANGSRRPLAGS